MASKIDEVYKTLVRTYAYKSSEPLQKLNADIMAMQSQGRSRERAVLELALQIGFRPPEYLFLLREEGKTEEQAISEFLKDEIISVEDTDREVNEIIADATWSKVSTATTTTEKRGEPSKAWYLAPLLLSILGGLIGYVAVKDEDRGMADNLLLLGILIFFLNLVALWILL